MWDYLWLPSCLRSTVSIYPQCLWAFLNALLISTRRLSFVLPQSFWLQVLISQNS